MKPHRNILLGLSIFHLLASYNISYAVSVNTHVESYVEGGTSSINTTTNVQSSNSSNTTVYKRVETNVNGEKKVVESREPGELKVEVKNGSVSTSTVNKQISITPNVTPSVIPTMQIEQKNLNKSLVASIQEFISNILKKLFR